MRILLLAPRWPLPARRGYERRVLELSRALQAHGEVRLICFGGGEPLPHGGVTGMTVRRGLATPALGNLQVPDPLLPGQVRLYLDARMRRAVEREVERFRPDVVSATLARMAPYLPPAGGAHRHVDLIDALSVNMARRAEAEAPLKGAALGAEARLMARYEARVVREADSSSLVAASDITAVPALAGCAVVPMGVDLDSLDYVAPADRPPVLTFFGNLGYFPNVESARVVAEEVLPRVRERVPAATLRLVGARPAPAVRRLDALDGVTVVGPVDRMADALHAAAVAVVPTYSGSGMKTKVTEAMAAGTPVVANAMALEGIDGARAGADHLLGETPAELADAAVRLLEDAAERVRLAESARSLVEARFTWAARAADLVELWRR